MKTANSNLYDSIKELTVHDHACLIYNTNEEQFRYIVPFIKIGLERGERCIYVVDDNSSQTVLDAMQKDGIDTDSAIKTGSLNIITKHDSYLKQGVFEPESMLQFLKESIDSAKAEGYKALRATGEATWLVHGYPGVERFMEYEAKLNDFFPENDILAVCQYNSNRIPPDIILNCIHTHPTVMHDGLVCKNSYYIPPEEFLRPNQKDIEVNRLLSNITKNKQAEEALQRSNLLLSSIIESPDNVIIVVLDRDYNYLSFNTAHAKEMKRVYDADIEIGQHILSYIPVEADRLKAEENYIRVLKGERFVKIENYGFPDSRYWYELVFNPIYDNSHYVTGFTVFATDITERKKMEETLVQSEKMKSIGTITAGISHEFNNLLAIISGNVQLLNEDYKGDRVLANALNIILKAADDGAEISSNMLKFTKTVSDIKEFVSFDICELIRHSIDFTKPRWKNEAQARGIDYKMDMESMKSISYIMCKPAEIREIFINIINNSLDAMPNGGHIAFSTWNGGDTMFVSATDNGVGMSESVKKNIFDPFFSTKGADGTGLGLSMVYGIVTRHGGKIDVASEIGKGTTFTMQFPATNKRKSLMKVPDTKQETNVKSLRILVVDDEEAIRDILNQFLSRSGHNVKTVDNGADAINMVEGEGFDLVLCDLAMPNVFGYDVVKTLNSLKKRPKIGIVTGWSEERVADKDMKVDFYLSKPFKHAELMKHVDELFGADSR